MPASVLSWMAMCPLAKSIILSSGGAFTYATPPTVEKLKDAHDALVKSVAGAVERALSGRFSYLKLEPSNGCLTLRLERHYVICGRPDLVYLVRGRGSGFFALVVDATLSPSVRHKVQGEMVFYIMECFMRYGIATVGLIVGTKLLVLAAPVFSTEGGVPAMLRNLFKKPEYGSALREAERRRARKPWMCSFCDLKHLCPLGGEI
ncbi:MAG: hypothetical protein QXJ59_07065 [Thermofilaceae archaeon]